MILTPPRKEKENDDLRTTFSSSPTVSTTFSIFSEEDDESYERSFTTEAMAPCLPKVIGSIPNDMKKKLVL